MRTIAVSLAGSVLLMTAAAARAETVVYDFGKNGENKTNVTWESKATIETILGTSVQCNGIAVWDAKDPGKSLMAFCVPVASIKTGIDMRDDHLRSTDWMDAQTYPTIAFKSKSFKPVADKKDQYEVSGAFICKGITQEMTIPVTITATPAKKGLEKYGYVGDILHLEARFTVKLADHNITVPQPMAGVKVSETVNVSVDLFGFTNDKPQRSAEEIEKALAEIK